MPLQASFRKYTLQFKFDAGTSRGILKERDTYLLEVWDQDQPECTGLGEAAPLKGLSPEFDQVETSLLKVCKLIQGIPTPSSWERITEIVDQLVSPATPSVRFALETALLDLLHGGRRLLFEESALEGKFPIPINGLIWMGSFDFMKQQVDQKIIEGYQCIKIKIGALEFERECDLLNYIRQSYAREITLRVDANGAFAPREVDTRLTRLQQFDLHSIEQPVRPGQLELMQRICRDALVPVALDEELIGTTNPGQQQALLDLLRPQYIVLKPTLLGGLKATRNWIKFASERKINWWITSALESNVGLNALAQFTASLAPRLPQGLGTGQLFDNNLPGNLHISSGSLYYSP